MNKLTKFVVALLVSAIALTGCGGKSAIPTAPGPVVVTPPSNGVVYSGSQQFGEMAAGHSFGMLIPMVISSGRIEVKLTSRPDGELVIKLYKITDNVLSPPSATTVVKVVGGSGSVSIPVVADTNFVSVGNSNSPAMGGVAEVSVMR